MITSSDTECDGFGLCVPRYFYDPDTHQVYSQEIVRPGKSQAEPVPWDDVFDALSGGSLRASVAALECAISRLPDTPALMAVHCAMDALREAVT